MQKKSCILTFFQTCLNNSSKDLGNDYTKKGDMTVKLAFDVYGLLHLP